MTGFDKLFDTHRKALAAFILRRFGNAFSAQEIEDVLQETYLKGSSAYGRTLVRSPKTWLHQVAISQALTRLRVRDRRREASYEELCEGVSDEMDMTDDDAGPEAVVAAVQETFRLYAAVCALPSIYREAVELFYLRELHISEIRERLGLNDMTFRNRLFRAIRMLRTKMIPQNEEAPAASVAA